MSGLAPLLCWAASWLSLPSLLSSSRPFLARSWLVLGLGATGFAPDLGELADGPQQLSARTWSFPRPISRPRPVDGPATAPPAIKCVCVERGRRKGDRGHKTWSCPWNGWPWLPGDGDHHDRWPWRWLPDRLVHQNGPRPLPGMPLTLEFLPVSGLEARTDRSGPSSPPGSPRGTPALDREARRPRCVEDLPWKVGHGPDRALTACLGPSCRHPGARRTTALGPELAGQGELPNLPASSRFARDRPPSLLDARPARLAQAQRGVRAAPKAGRRRAALWVFSSIAPCQA